MKISAEAATANQQLINEMQTKWKEQEKLMEDRTYFKYLAYSCTAFENMDLTERALLDVIAACNVERLKVTEAMSLNMIASPATLHRKLNSLLKAGWIEHQTLDSNKRDKYLVPSPKAMTEYDKLNKAIREAVTK